MRKLNFTDAIQLYENKTTEFWDLPFNWPCKNNTGSQTWKTVFYIKSALLNNQWNKNKLGTLLL